VLADFRVPGFNRVFSHTRQIGICRAANPLGIGEVFGEMRFGEAKEFAFAYFLTSVRIAGFSPSIRSVRVVHGNGLPAPLSRDLAAAKARRNLTSAACAESP